MLLCYNRGCGQKFDPENNPDDSCQHHPGHPVFHDAYKGWSCCNKKSTDFTEFLNIKGCTKSKHSNVKPPEPVKPAPVQIDEPPKEIRKPIKESTLVRPSFDTGMKTLVPSIAQNLQESFEQMMLSNSGVKKVEASTEIPVGTVCKNKGCNATYESPDADRTNCVHHPGVPIFHEGMKYWSCCQKKTSDFTAFMNQVGCAKGEHKWIETNEESKTVNCRYDWHQTATNVIVTLYAKKYHLIESYVKANPIRLKIHAVFPEQNSATYDLDLELKGIVDIDKSTVNMFGTKIEVVLVKAEPGTWAKLDVPRKLEPVVKEAANEKPNVANTEDSDGEIDLGEVEAVKGCTIEEVN